MEINENAGLEHAGDCWVLTVKEQKVWTGKGNKFIQEGQAYESESKTYHATVPQAVRYYLNNIPSEDKTFEEYVTRLENLVNKLSNTLNNALQSSGVIHKGGEPSPTEIDSENSGIDGHRDGPTD